PPPPPALRTLADVTEPGLTLRIADIIREAVQHRPESLGECLAAYVDRRLDHGPAARALLHPLVTGLLHGGPVRVRSALAAVLAPAGTPASRALRRELREFLLRHERDPAVLGALLLTAVRQARAHDGRHVGDWRDDTCSRCDSDSRCGSEERCGSDERSGSDERCGSEVGSGSGGRDGSDVRCGSDGSRDGKVRCVPDGCRGRGGTDRSGSPALPDLVHRIGLLLVRTPEGAALLDRSLVDLGRRVPGFAVRMAALLTEAPEDWAAVVGPGTRRMLEDLAGMRVPA
ncbi:hypothetical protein ACL02U_28205, partial [Streptomyces sp. MS06]